IGPVLETMLSRRLQKMKQHLAVSAGLSFLCLLASGQAFGQGYIPGAGFSPYRRPLAPYQRPAVSPYLNLLRGGADPAINYYGLVRPQMEFRNSLVGIAEQQALGQQSISDLESSLDTSGHRSLFMNHQRYFMNLGISAGPQAGRQVGARPQMTSSTSMR